MFRNLIKSNSVANFARFSYRTYLSEAYKCTDAWNQRLNSPILQKANVDNFYYELDTKFQQQKNVSAIDIDIYANKITDGNHVEEIADLIHKLRLTQEASNVLESTGHAIVRNYLEHNQIEPLINVLNHRLDFGVFLDYFSANLVLDKLIEDKNFKAAARIATIFALQESFDNPITNYLSLYACYKFLGDLQTFDDLIEPVVEEVVTTGKKKKEEIKVRVDFIRNEYFDDHFDIKSTNHLVGKTLVYLAGQIQDQLLSDSVKLLGLGLYEKYDKASQLLETKKPFYKDAVEILKNLSAKVENLDGNESAKKFFDTVNQLDGLADGNVAEVIEKQLKDVIASNESKNIEEQVQVYSSWNQLREQRLNEEMERLLRIQRLQNVQDLQKQMESEERKLWFFENEDKIDLEIEGKKVYYPKRWFGKKKKPRVVDENYIPPDVDQRRN